MISKTTASAVDIQKALGLKGSLKYVAVDNDTEVLVSVAVTKSDFLKAMKLSGTLQDVETASNDGVITEVVITSVVDASAPAKRGRKPKNTVVTP
jgi:hypothetical protein